MSKSHLTCFCGMLSPWGCLALSLTCHAPYSHLMWLSAGAPFAAVEGYGEGVGKLNIPAPLVLKVFALKTFCIFFALAFALFVRLLLLLPLLLHLLAPFSVSVKCATTQQEQEQWLRLRGAGR